MSGSKRTHADTVRGYLSEFGIQIKGIKISVVEPGVARAEARVQPEMMNPHGVVHGGVHYALADSVMGTAVSSRIAAKDLCATIEIQIRYLRAVSKGSLTAIGRVLHQGEKIAFVEAKVTDERNRLVAMATGSFYVSRKAARGIGAPPTDVFPPGPGGAGHG